MKLKQKKSQQLSRCKQRLITKNKIQASRCQAHSFIQEFYIICDLGNIDTREKKIAQFKSKNKT
ncbi:CLUMA_CG013845, isoform A [Clunio marinus]|uniref:CLUMA_CG013845, isoform A n=1 Tax=Clunio marinus TaxID=568069 RepID=A0A1J1IQ06_9DIPT|nr:CLUMA_CG013845, isoform A [Clunio marinus]